MARWIFTTRRRLLLSVLVLSAVSLVLAVGSLAIRISHLPATGGAATNPAPRPVSTALLPPTPTTIGPSASAWVGSSAPIAVEAVQAFLLHDVAGFSALATPEAAEEVGDAPAPDPGGQITAEPVVVHDGPTQQDLRVPTTWGDLDLTMVYLDERWLVDSMEYHR